MALTQKNREAELATPLGPDVLLLQSMNGTEELGRLFQYDLELLCENKTVNPKDIVGQNVTIRLNLPNQKIRYFNGFVSRFVQTPADTNVITYRATVVPWMWFLTRTADCRIFQEKTVPDIIKQIFADRGFTDIKDSLTNQYRTWEYCVQYRETDFNFVSRLMEQDGIYYFFTHENGKHTLVLSDSLSAHEAYEGYGQFKYRPFQTGEKKETVTSWTTQTQLQPGTYCQLDYDFKDTRKDMLTRHTIKREHTLSEFELFDYPGEYVELPDGENYTKIRIEELQAQYEVSSAATDVMGAACGHTFKLLECPGVEAKDQHLIISANYYIHNGEFIPGKGGSEPVFSCNMMSIPAKTQFRPLRTTPKPSIPGPQTAIVVGPSGEEIHTDEHGRIKVKFHWDRHNKADEKSSCWIRVAQIWAGKNWGAIYLPRIGQEVVVEFLEGDPDQPLITGRVYNGSNKPPYTLPAEKTKSTLKSLSSKGGGGFNEIRLEDKKGEEQIFIHGEKNQDIRIKNDTKEWIGHNQHLIVKADQYETVEGDKHQTVKGDHVVEIQGDQNFTIKGSHLTDIVGKKHLAVSGDQFEKIGGNQHFKAAMNLNEEIGQKLSVKAGTDIHEKAGMNYALNAGMAVHIKGGMTVVIEGGAQLSLKVGGNFIDINPGGVFIQGTLVMINSGGAAGAGSGSSPTAPTAPEAPDVPKLPEEADHAQPGQKEEPPRLPKPPKPVKYSPQATTLKSAAESGTPFCEKCEEARKKQKSKT